MFLMQAMQNLCQCGEVFTSYFLESDCEYMVKRINGGQKDWSVLRHLVESIQEVINSSPNVKLEFISRKINVPTHLLAKFACDTLEIRI